MEWAKNTYNNQYENWVPWMEDLYLRWFTKDNKTSYTARQNLDKTKVTGIQQVDTLQDGVNNLAASQLGQGGLFQPITDMSSKEGINRAERNGKDENGSYVPTSIPGSETVGNAASTVADGGKSIVGGTADGVKSAGGLLGGAFGGGKKQEEQQQQ